MTVPSIPQISPDHHDDNAEVVLGVDTHRDLHACAVLSAIGRLLATATFPTTAAGYRDMVAWARAHGSVRRAGVECTRSYGAALTRALLSERIQVIEVNQPDRGDRRRRGKSDTNDAEAAARAVIAGRATAIAKTGDGAVEAVRVLKLARHSAVNASTKAINQLKAVIVGASPQLREMLTGLGPKMLIRHCAQLPDPCRWPVAHLVATLAHLLGTFDPASGDSAESSRPIAAIAAGGTGVDGARCRRNGSARPPVPEFGRAPCPAAQPARRPTSISVRPKPHAADFAHVARTASATSISPSYSPL